MHKSEENILNIRSVSGYIWPHEIHETLILAIYFTYLSRFLLELCGENLLVELGRHLWGVIKKDRRLVGDILSRLFQQTRGMDALPFSKRHKLFSPGPSSSFPSEYNYWV